MAELHRKARLRKSTISNGNFGAQSGNAANKDKASVFVGAMARMTVSLNHWSLVHCNVASNSMIEERFGLTASPTVVPILQLRLQLYWSFRNQAP
jgi:hypothetical protein